MCDGGRIGRWSDTVTSETDFLSAMLETVEQHFCVSREASSVSLTLAVACWVTRSLHSQS